MKLETLLKRLNIVEVGQPALGIREFRLGNGLRVLLHQDHIAPVVTHAIGFRVGSVNEGAGETGSTHFLEHMMFMGTDKFGPDKGNGFDQLLVPLGAVNNAMTYRDWTIYYENGASEHIELFIRMNADRVRGLKLRQHDHDSEMTVVRNEMEQGENDPSDALGQALWAQAFTQFPYHHDTIGYRSDVEGMPISVLAGHYNRYYYPNNAAVAVSGDFDLAQVLRLVNKYYGKLEPAEHIPSVYTVEPPQKGERRFEVRMPGYNDMVAMGFHTPAASHADFHALAVLDHLFGNSSDRTSPLYKRFVATRLCSAIHSAIQETRYPGLFAFEATCTSGTDPKKVEAEILAEIERLKVELFSDEELTRVKAAQAKEMRLALASAQRLAIRAMQVDAQTGWRFMAEFTEKFNAVTAEDIRRVVQTYFTEKNRTVGYLIVEDAEEQVEEQQEAPAAVAMSDAQILAEITRKRKLRRAPRPTIKLQTSGRVQYGKQVSSIELPNGVKLVVLPHAGSGVVGLNVAVNAGVLYSQPNELGVATLVTSLLGAGSARYTKQQVAEAYLEMGVMSSARWNDGNETASLGTQLAAEDLPKFLDIIADQLRQPLFEDEELATAKMKRLAQLEQAADDPSQVAMKALLRTLYAEGHPLRATTFAEMKESVPNVSADQLRAFHSRCYVPSGTVISLVGDVTLEQARELVAKAFGDWTGPAGPVLENKAAPLTPATTVKSPMDAKSTIEIKIAHPLELVTTDREFAALELGNAALGLDTMMSRLGSYLRVRKGFTYGAYTRFVNDGYRGAPWMLTFSVNPKVLDTALRAANIIIRDTVENGISEDEYQMAQGMTVGLFQLRMGTMSGIASLLTRYTLLGLGFDKIDAVAEQYGAITRDEVNAALRKFIKPENLVTSLAGTFQK